MPIETIFIQYGAIGGTCILLIYQVKYFMDRENKIQEVIKAASDAYTESLKNNTIALTRVYENMRQCQNIRISKGNKG